MGIQVESVVPKTLWDLREHVKRFMKSRKKASNMARTINVNLTEERVEETLTHGNLTQSLSLSSLFMRQRSGSRAEWGGKKEKEKKKTTSLT